jgi:hypothetical protein
MTNADMEFGGPALGAWPTRKGEKLRPHKGGDSSGMMSLAMEQDRQNRIKAATKAVNAVFADAGRQKLYDEQKQAVYDINAKSVADQYEDAERANRFGLARSGLLGGSAEIDSIADLQEKNNEGLMKAVGLGDAAASDLKKADEGAKHTLISLAQTGIDTGTAANMALNNLNANQQAAAGTRAGSSLSGLFGDMSQAYLTNQYLKGLQAGIYNSQQQQAGYTNSPQKTYSGYTG